MFKLVFRWLIIVTLFTNQFAFAGPVFSRPATASPSYTDRTGESTPLRPKLYAKPGKVRSALASIGKFFHNHSDFICRTSILLLDAIYFLGTFFPEVVSPDVTNASFTCLGYVGLIGLPFAVREAAKAARDTKYACKRGCKEIIFIGSLRTASNAISALSTLTYSVAATLLDFEKTHDSGMAIYKYSAPLGIFFIILNPSLDIYNFILNKRIIREFDRDHSSSRMKNQIALLRGIDVENIPVSEAKLSALVRSQIDLVTWGKFLETTRPGEQVPLLSGILVSSGDEDQTTIAFAVIIDNIKVQKNYAVGDLVFNVFCDLEMGVIKVSGPGKLQAALNLGTAVMCDIILGVKKCKQARHRTRLQAIEQERDLENQIVRQPRLDIGTVELPNPDFVIEISEHETITDSYSFTLAKNQDIPIEVRIVAAHGCNPIDSWSLACNPKNPLEVRIASAHHCSPVDSYLLACNPRGPLEVRIAAARGCNSIDSSFLAHTLDIPIEVRRVAQLKISLENLECSQPIIEESSQTSIVPYKDECVEERQRPTHDRFISLSRHELFIIASNPEEQLDVRCGATYLLK